MAPLLPERRRSHPGGATAGDPIDPDGLHRARARRPQNPLVLVLARFGIVHQRLAAAHPEHTRGQEGALTITPDTA